MQVQKKDDTMKKAHSISQEYWYIRKQKCECGSEFELIDQAMTVRREIHVDVHRTRCKQCGTFREFIFDISSFHKPYQSFSELAQVEDVLKNAYPESEVSMRMACPMEATLMYIEQLKEARDIMALEYIVDVAQCAIRNINKGQTA